MSIRQKNILIVGGAGYIGSHINKYLNKLGYNTIVFDNLSTGYKDFVKWGEFVFGDMNDPKQLRLLFKKYEIDCVMHFAANANVGESVEQPKKYYTNNVINTLNLLEAMLEAGVKKFIFSSSCAVYGEPEVGIIDENVFKNPINPYGRTKLMVENILEDYSSAYGLKYCALRYFNAAGCDVDLQVGEQHIPETHLIPLILDAAIGKRETITIFGTDYETPDGTCIRDYIHTDDLAKAHTKAIEYLFDGGESNVFNLGIGKGYSVKEIIDSVKRVTKKDFNVIEGKRRPGDPPKLISLPQKAKNILGWQAEYTKIDDIILTAWNWHKTMNNKK